MTVSQDAQDEGRRARARRETLVELTQAAFDELREHGAVSLSLRRVARRMGMSPAGLYRYVDSREDLLTWLIAHAYDDLADHMLVAIGAAPSELSDTDRPAPRVAMVSDAGDDVGDRVRAVAAAYRQWAVAHPNEFGLLFGDPIPGYTAPPDGPTTAAMTRVGEALGRPLVEAWQQGRLRPSVDDPPDRLRERLAPMGKLADMDVPAELAVTMLLAWGRLHGQVSLEVFGHHDWLFPEGSAVLFDADVEAILRDLGITDA